MPAQAGIQSTCPSSAWNPAFEGHDAMARHDVRLAVELRNGHLVYDIRTVKRGSDVDNEWTTRSSQQGKTAWLPSNSD